VKNILDIYTNLILFYIVRKYCGDYLSYNISRKYHILNPSALRTSPLDRRETQNKKNSPKIGGVLKNSKNELFNHFLDFGSRNVARHSASYDFLGFFRSNGFDCLSLEHFGFEGSKTRKFNNFA